MRLSSSSSEPALLLWNTCMCVIFLRWICRSSVALTLPALWNVTLALFLQKNKCLKSTAHSWCFSFLLIFGWIRHFIASMFRLQHEDSFIPGSSLRQEPAAGCPGKPRGEARRGPPLEEHALPSASPFFWDRFKGHCDADEPTCQFSLISTLERLTGSSLVPAASACRCSVTNCEQKIYLGGLRGWRERMRYREREKRASNWTHVST